jgi:pyruvate dehydrogenase E1 component beta subunit
LAVAEEVAPEISVEVFDPRTLLPFDWDLLVESVGRTRRLVVYDDTNRSCGLAGEIVATVCEQVDLASRPHRVTRADVPVPFTPDLELAMLPDRDSLRQTIRASVGAVS